MSDDAFLRTLIDETVARAVETVRTPVIRSGTVINSFDLDNVQVLVDGDVDPIIAPSVIGPLYDGVRVVVLFNPPAGAMIFGYKYTGFIQQLGSSAWLPEHGATAPRIQIGNDGVPSSDDVGFWVMGADGKLSIYFGTVGGVPLVSIRGPHVGYDTGYDTVHIENGVTFNPQLTSPWQRDGNRTIDANGRAIVSSGTYTAMASTFLANMSGGFYTYIDVIPGAGVTSCALRVMARAVGATSVQVFEQTGITVPSVIQPQAHFPDTVLTPPGDPLGALIELTLEAKVTGGAGNVSVLARAPCVAVVV